MGVLFPIVHAERVTEPRRVAALFRALGAQEVWISGLRPADRAGVERLIAAIDPGLDASVWLARGSLGAATFAALERLVEAAPGYLDVGAAGTSLRLWPAKAWLHRRELPPGGVPAVAAACRRALGVRRELGAGKTELGETTLSIDPGADGSWGRALAVDLRTPDRRAALELFEALVDDAPATCLVMHPNEATKQALPAFLFACGGEVEASLEVSCDTAAELALALPGELSWQARGVEVELPGGEVSTCLLVPFRPEEEAAFHAAITAALARADQE